ncbi:hypothetical protein CLIB1444_08S02190 [[Candida] jaroonii]|uniref:Uncharacterized protein n=1 Tax=[Candida] jaroonii TaxID=467808 RepID=A0ACA9YBN9_9ASCO|nr:hypothetical protein CLIB1444_08S02190 [[Candida] jaroonii]
MKITSFFTTLCLIAQALSDNIEISSDTKTWGQAVIEYSDVTIDSGATWKIVDVGYVHFHDNFLNNGDFFVTSTQEDQAINFKIADFKSKTTNNGRMVISSGSSFFSPSFSINGGSFENNGKAFFSGNSKSGIPISQITPRSFTNNGLIALYQDKKNSGLVDLGQLWQSFTNDGTVCLRNQAFDQQSAIKGKGCFDIGENSNVWIKTSLLPISTDQVFYFSSDYGSIRVEAVSGTQTFNVKNWGGNNIIGLSLPISSFGYTPGSGVLTLTCGFLNFNFNIGKGYDINLMQKVTADYGSGGIVINGGLVYKGSTPQNSRPDICMTCEDVPEFSV